MNNIIKNIKDDAKENKTRKDNSYKLEWDIYIKESKTQTMFDNNTYNSAIIKTPFFDSINVIYADFTASGKMFKPIERFMENRVYPYYANTHSNAYNGRLMSHYIQESKNLIRKVINANKSDSIIFTGQGCSSAVTHFIHILDIKECTDDKKFVVFITDYEHNSNFLPWRIPSIDLVIIPSQDNGLINLEILDKELQKYKNRKRKIISFSAGSNISGIVQNMSDISILGHKYDFIVAFDCAAVAPYININMHNNDKTGDYIDAIYISPHKFLGGPGSPGLLVANDKLFTNKCPFFPSGGTIRYTSKNINIYSNNNEVKETGGTPNILGCIKTGLVFYLKDILLQYIQKKEVHMVNYVRYRLNSINDLHVIIPNCENDVNIIQIPIFSFIIKDLHYNFIVVLLNDLFGIQTRGGVSCAGLYANKVLKISKENESDIIRTILDGKGVPKEYGWCRVTFHYTMSHFIVEYILDSIEFIAKYGINFLTFYNYSSSSNLWNAKHFDSSLSENKLNFNYDKKLCSGMCITEKITKINLKNCKKLLIDILTKKKSNNKLNVQKKNINPESDERDTFSMT